MFAGASMLLAAAIFIGSAGAVWLAGIWLSETTDALERRFGFGEAVGGLLILAITTNLPEIAITTGAAVSGDLSIAIGNILGGIAIQTMVLVVLDASLRSAPTLPYPPARLVLGL